MRYTLDNTLLVGLHADVWLDDEPVKHVIEADTDEGYIIRYKSGSDGMLIVDGDEVVTERIEGHVRVETYAPKAV